MSSIRFSPKNDLAFTIPLWDVNTSTGVKTPLTTGSFDVFLAVTDAPDATPADASLVGVATFISATNRWLVFIDAFRLQDVALLDSLFTDGELAYVILEQTNNVRVAVPVLYQRAFDAVTQ